MPASMTYVAPGTYLTSVTTPPFAPGGLTGRVSCILGTAPHGPVASNLIYLSAADAFADFGSPTTADPNYTIPMAIQAFFSQQGQSFGLTPGLIIRRLGTQQAGVLITGTTGSCSVYAKNTYGGNDGNNAWSTTASAYVGGVQVLTGTPVWNVSTSQYDQTISVYSSGTGFGSVENWTIHDTQANNGANAMHNLYLMLLQNSQIVTPVFTAANGATTASLYVNGSAGTGWPLSNETWVLGVGWGPTSGGGWTTSSSSIQIGTNGLGYTIPAADANNDLSSLEDPSINCDDVQALYGDLATAQQVLTHVTLMSGSSSRPQIGWGGALLGTSLSTLQSNAQTLANSRFVYCGHDGVQMINPLTGTPGNFHGWLMATMMMGADASLPAGMPLTYKPIFGISGPSSPLTLSQANALASAGCMIITRGPTGNWVVRDDLTTLSPPGINEFTYLINQTSLDVLFKRLYAYSQTTLIGQRGGSNFSQLIVGGFKSVCSQAIQDGVIQGLISITPVPSKTDPTAWTVTVAVIQNGEVRVININIATSF